MNENVLQDPLLTVPQVAKHLQISRSKAYLMVSRKRIPHIRLDRNIRIRQSDLTRWLNQQYEKEK